MSNSGTSQKVEKSTKWVITDEWYDVQFKHEEKGEMIEKFKSQNGNDDEKDEQ